MNEELLDRIIYHLEQYAIVLDLEFSNVVTEEIVNDILQELYLIKITHKDNIAAFE